LGAAAASSSFSSSTNIIMPSTNKKTLYILRHGQAMHNPRAEVARADGCSKDEFLLFMQQDDCLDAPLTDRGKEQAQTVRLPVCPDLVVASPLSRALATADLALGLLTDANKDSNDHAAAAAPQQVRVGPRYLCYEGFREINGWLLNAKRRSRAELQEEYPHWDFTDLSTDDDALWGPELEAEAACGERGYQGLRRLLSERPEPSILLVVHGGLLSFTMHHPYVQVRDERSNQQERSCRARFSNCELRKYILEAGRENGNIVLTELDVPRL
jgi:broad specificity phosphatase PhoE